MSKLFGTIGIDGEVEIASVLRLGNCNPVCCITMDTSSASTIHKSPISSDVSCEDTLGRMQAKHGGIDAEGDCSSKCLRLRKWCLSWGRTRASRDVKHSMKVELYLDAKYVNLREGP